MQHLFRFFLVPLFMTCCAAGGPDFSVGSVDVFIEDGVAVNYREVERTIRYTADAYGKPHLLKDGVTEGRLFLVKDKIPCPHSPLGWCYGLTTGFAMQVYMNDMKCLGSTALVHELLHWLLTVDKKSADGGHTNPKIWKKAGGVTSIEEATNTMINLNLGCW